VYRFKASHIVRRLHFVILDDDNAENISIPSREWIHHPLPCLTVSFFFFLWIFLADKEVPLGHHSSNKLLNTERASLVTWEPYYCVLLQDDQTFTAYRSEEMAVSFTFHLSRLIKSFAYNLFPSWHAYLVDKLRIPKTKNNSWILGLLIKRQNCWHNFACSIFLSTGKVSLKQAILLSMYILLSNNE
jgi:hypothetical protein